MLEIWEPPQEEVRIIYIIQEKIKDEVEVSVFPFYHVLSCATWLSMAEFKCVFYCIGSMAELGQFFRGGCIIFVCN